MAARVRKRGVDDPEIAEFLGGQQTYVFQTPAWCRVMAALGYEVAYYCLEEDGRIRLAQQAVRLQLSFFRLLYCGLPYGGPAGETSRAAEFIDLLAPVARGEGIHRFRLSRNFYDVDLPDLPQCTVQEHVQQVLHFAGRGEARVWEDLKPRVRRDVRLAERRGVVVEDGRDPAARDALFRMYERTMARNEAFVVWKREMIERIWELLVEPGQGEMLIARHEGEALAGMVTLYSGKRCFYFLGASSGEKRNLCPNDAVIWQAIRRAMARGCEDFDFMMSSRDDSALIAFKAKWGTTAYPFCFHERDLSRVACGLWNVSFRIARTTVGGRLIRLVRGR